MAGLPAYPHLPLFRGISSAEKFSPPCGMPSCSTLLNCSRPLPFHGLSSTTQGAPSSSTFPTNSFFPPARAHSNQPPAPVGPSLCPAICCCFSRRPRCHASEESRGKVHRMLCRSERDDSVPAPEKGTWSGALHREGQEIAEDEVTGSRTETGPGRRNEGFSDVTNGSPVSLMTSVEGSGSNGAAGAPQSMSAADLWRGLSPSLSYLPAQEQAVVRDALDVAYWAHEGQKRRSGEPFIVHPVEVARILADLRMDWESVVAGLLHDTVEDTDRLSFTDIESKYGVAVRRIVEGETKVSKLGKVQAQSARRHMGEQDGACSASSGSDSELPSASRNESIPNEGPRPAKADVKAQDLRQMFVAMTEEVRVIIVKLADRLHNMRTLGHMPAHKQEHIAKETLRVFAPLARLLGIYSIKAELEDLSFRYAHPVEYGRVLARLQQLKEEQGEGLLRAEGQLQRALQKDQFLSLRTRGVRVARHWKEPYSVFRKLGREYRLEEVQCVAQLRVVLELQPPQQWQGRQPVVAAAEARAAAAQEAQQVCYHVLGLVHSLWSPLPGSVKDYIATPKPNGYQSLHTTVLPRGGGAVFPLEVHIRTDEMDALAEGGITTQLAAVPPTPTPVTTLSSSSPSTTTTVDVGASTDATQMLPSKRLEQRMSGPAPTASSPHESIPVAGRDVQSAPSLPSLDTSSSPSTECSRPPHKNHEPSLNKSIYDEICFGEVDSGSAVRPLVNGEQVPPSSSSETIMSVPDLGLRQASELSADREEFFESEGVGEQQQQQQQQREADSGTPQRVSWLSAIRKWQEEFVGSLSAREFVDTCDLNMGS